MADSLVGIPPHPGPTRRGVRSMGEGRRRRNGARRERRRRGERLGVETGVGILGLMALLLVVTWNVRRLSVRETNRRRLRSVAERVRQERWEMVLLTELRADEEGVVWVGGGRGEGGADPREEGGSNVKGRSARKVGGREAAEVVWGEGSSGGGGGIETGVSIPAKLGGRMGKAWKDVDGTWKGRWQRGTGERIAIGMDFNASIGWGGERRGVCGKYGLGRGNEAGRDLVDWCEEMGMAHVNSFMRYKRRGTWRHPATGRWHELDRFLVRGGE